MNNQREVFEHFLGEKASILYKIETIESKDESNKTGEKLQDLKKIN